MANDKHELRQQPKYGKGEYSPIETGDTDAILALGIQAVRRGAVAKYPQDINGFNDFVAESQNYLEAVNAVNSNPEIERKVIVDIEGWCTYIGISRQTLMMYSKRPEPWREFIEYFKTVILSVKKQLALTNRIPAVAFVFDACNNHNYQSVNQIQVQTVQPEQQREFSSEELYKMASKLPGFSNLDDD